MTVPVLYDNKDVVTMTSPELVDFINANRSSDSAELRHDHFMAKVPLVLGAEGAPNFRGTYRDVQNKERPCYNLPKREACLMAMSYSYELQAKVFDRMTALEAGPVIPKTLSAALRLAADQADQIEQQQAALALAAPKVAFVDNYVEATNLRGFREAAKLLKANEARLREFLVAKRIMYRLGTYWMPYQPHIDAGRFEVKTGEANKYAFNRALLTARGVEWLAGLWAVEQLGGAAA